ncbi:MAG: hypothetical protein HYX79_05050 [Chloroflexi bacterium]|nr:hypothetical protein [Chloroflexota bacterium]
MKRFMKSTKVIAPVLLFLGIAVVALSVNYIKVPPWETVVTTIGSIMVGVGLVEWIFHIYAAEEFVSTVSNAVLKAIKLPIKAFYESRKELEPVENQLANVGELWAAWHTGPYANFEAFFPVGRSGRILLTKPSPSIMQALSTVGERDADSMKHVIIEVTRKAQQNGLEIKWFDGPICNSIIIADPRKDNAWARLDVLVPKQPPQKRPSFLVEKRQSKELFETLYRSFEKMWAASEEPDLVSSQL